MNRKRIIIYPFNSQFSPILRHKGFLEDYDIHGLISPRGWGIAEKDAGAADNGSSLDMQITSDFDGALESCDAVLFCESENKLDLDSYIMPKVLKAIECGKDIVFTIRIEDRTYDTIYQKCSEKGVNFKYYNYPEKQRHFNEIDVDDEFLHDIKVPVIFVLGMGERTNKFETQLVLRDKLVKMGYKVAQIGSRGYCELLGFHSFPQFMLNHALSESNKIVLFNHFIKTIEIDEEPDLVIIGVPGGILPLTTKLTNRFGILTYEVSQAITPDSTVLCCYYQDFDKDYFTRVSDSVRYRFGCKIDCFNIANVSFDWQNSIYENRKKYISLGTKFVDENKKHINGTVFNVLNNQDANSMTEYLVDKLSEYANIQCL